MQPRTQFCHFAVPCTNQTHCEKKCTRATMSKSHVPERRCTVFGRDGAQRDERRKPARSMGRGARVKCSISLHFPTVSQRVCGVCSSCRILMLLLHSIEMSHRTPDHDHPHGLVCSSAFPQVHISTRKHQSHIRFFGALSFNLFFFFLHSWWLLIFQRLGAEFRMVFNNKIGEKPWRDCCKDL